MTDNHELDDEEERPSATPIELVTMEFIEKAHWRRGKARQYPDDERNLDAAELLDRLAREVLSLSDSPTAKAFEEAHDAIFSMENRDQEMTVMLLWSDYRSGIGFKIFPDTGEKVLWDMIQLTKTGGEHKN